MTQKINEPSSAYLSVMAQWERCRDAVAGTDAVKAKGAKYLPRLAGQTDAEYADYRLRADFFNATSRTVSGLSGLIFRKRPQVILPPAMVAIAESITPDGHNLFDLAEEVVEEVLTVNYVGLLVDHPEPAESVLTLAQASALGRRPYVSVYLAENILGVDHAIVFGRRVPVRVRLQEGPEVIRELRLDNGVYTVTLHTLAKGGDWVAGETRTPLADGRPLGFIPFLIASDKAAVKGPPKPLLLDVADLNLSHYRVTADIRHGLHYTALPTPYITGADEDMGEMRIGAATAWMIANSEATVEYLEFKGVGIGAYRTERLDIEAQMAALGARMLAPEKAAAEAAQTLAMRHAGENSVLASMAITISRQLTTVLQWIAVWAGIKGEPSIALNTVFIPETMSPQSMTAWVAAVQAGRVSQQSFFEALKAGELINPELTFEDEQERIAANVIDRPLGGE